MPALQVHNLDFAYGSVQVLFDVSFEVARGEVLALLGTNGAGKSTLLRAVSGLGIPDRGVVRLGGTHHQPMRRPRTASRPGWCSSGAGPGSSKNSAWPTT